MKKLLKMFWKVTTNTHALSVNKMSGQRKGKFGLKWIYGSGPLVFVFNSKIRLDRAQYKSS